MNTGDLAVIMGIFMIWLSVGISWWGGRKVNRGVELMKAVQSQVDHSMLLDAMVRAWRISRERPLQMLPPIDEFMQIVETIYHKEVPDGARYGLHALPDETERGGE
jgi:hypothetical protein